MFEQTKDYGTEKPAPKVATLRDQFAMAALTGIMANHESWKSPQERSELAYELADAMMKEREAKS
jgi:hypothetical protein